MLKTSLISLSFLALVGCASNYANYSTNLKYKISDEDTKKWIEEGNKIEQCLFPKQWKNANLNKLSDEEAFLYSEYVYKISFINVVGMDNFKIVSNDAESQQHTNQQFLKFNHSNKTDFDKNWCNNLKAQYAQHLAQIRENIKQQKAQAAAQKKAEIARQKQAEKERKAREAYLATPQGQAELSRQQMAEQHQQMMAQQQQMHNQMLAQQEAVQQQMKWQHLQSSLQQQNMMIQQQVNQGIQRINEMNNQLRMQGSRIGQGWAPSSGVHWNNIY